MVVERGCPTQQMLGVFLGGIGEKATSNWNCCAADGNISIGPINQSCGWLLRWRWDVCRKSLLLVWAYVRHPSVPGQNFAKSSARAGYTRLQGIRNLRTAEAAVKKPFITGVAALFLSTPIDLSVHGQRSVRWSQARAAATVSPLPASPA